MRLLSPCYGGIHTGPQLLSGGVTLLPAVETQEQTNAIILAKANAAAQGTDPENRSDRAEWQAMQEWLALGLTEVIVPFASSLGVLTKGIALRLRRDFPALLTLVMAHALLHRRTRKRRKNAVVAAIRDYRAVWKLVRGVIAGGVEATVSREIRETVQTVRKLESEAKSVTLAELARALDVHRGTAWRRAKAAIKQGYLGDLATRPGQDCQIVVANPLPEETDILPTPKAVSKHYKASRKATAPAASAGARRKRRR